MISDTRQRAAAAVNEAGGGSAAPPDRVPNFLYIGTSKAGSTWIFNLLKHHRDVYMVAGKGLYYFDGHYDKGQAWYLKHFAAAGDAAVVGEVSHSYLFSPQAVPRIAALNPDMKLMACLREPVERAFSAYLDGMKNGQFAPGTTFQQALDEDPALVDRGRYATHLKPYLAQFGLQRLHLADFAVLASQPRRFAEDIFRFLELPSIELPDSLLAKMMPAGRPRSRLLVRTVKRISHLALRLGLHGLRGRVKTSRRIRDLLYKQYTPDDRPTMHPATRAQLRQQFYPEVAELDRMIGSDYVARWGYADLQPQP